MKHKAATAAARRRRDKRAAKAAAELEEILADAVASQTMAIRRGFSSQAQRLTLADSSAFASGSDPTPPIRPDDLWNQGRWDDALEESDMLISSFVVDELDVDFGIRVTSEQPFVQGVTARLVSMIEDWTLDFKSLVSRVIDQGHRQLKSVDQVADDLQQAGINTRRQANAIARTQMVSASNAASYKGASTFAGPGDTKEWVATPDSRTRKDHKKAHGQVVPFDEPFVVGGERGMHPGDSSFSPAQLVNCRCTFTWIPGEDPSPVSDATIERAVKTKQRLDGQRARATRGAVDPDVLSRYGVNETQWRNAKAMLPGIKSDIRQIAKRESSNLSAWLDDRDLARLTRPTKLRKTADITGRTRYVRSESGYDWLEGLTDEEARQIRRRFTPSDLYTPDVVADQVRRITNQDFTDDEAINWLTERWLHADGLKSLSSGRVPSYVNPSGLLPAEYSLDGYDVVRLFGDTDDAVGHIAEVQAHQAQQFAQRALGSPVAGPAPWRMDVGDYVRELEEIEDVLRNPAPGVRTGAVDQARDRLRELAPPDIDIDGSADPVELFEQIRIVAQQAGYDVV